MTPSSCITSTRKLAPPEGGEPLLDGTGARTVRSGDLALEDVGERVAQTDHERPARLEHAVDLAEESPEVLDDFEGAVGEHDLDRPAGREPEIGELTDVALDADVGLDGLLAEFGDARSVGIDRQ